MVTLTWQNIISAGAVIGALGTIATMVVKLVRWIDHQKEVMRAEEIVLF